MCSKSLPLLIMGFFTLISVSAAWADAVVGQPAPALAAPTLAGQTFDLSTLKGKVVVVNFWATWCTPCRDEMPALEAVWRQYHSKGLEVLAVSANRPREHAEVDQVMHYFTFPAALLGATTKNDFGIPTTIPVTYIIGKDGAIADILTPDVKPLTEAAFGDEIKGLLDAKSETKPDVKADPKP